MAITVANPSEALEDLDDDSFQEEGTQYNFRELMDQVSTLKNCIITVPTSEVAALKTGLTTRKHKDNVKLKAAGIVVDNMTLKFMSYPAKDKEGNEIPDVSDVRVKLSPRKGVPVLDIRVPDDL